MMLKKLNNSLKIKNYTQLYESKKLTLKLKELNNKI